MKVCVVCICEYLFNPSNESRHIQCSKVEPWQHEWPVHTSDPISSVFLHFFDVLRWQLSIWLQSTLHFKPPLCSLFIPLLKEKPGLSSPKKINLLMRPDFSPVQPQEDPSMLTPDQLSGWCCRLLRLLVQIPVTICQCGTCLLPRLGATVSGELTTDVPLGVKPEETGPAQIRSRGDTDRMDTVT